jgi:hypothetical protein
MHTTKRRQIVFFAKNFDPYNFIEVRNYYDLSLVHNRNCFEFGTQPLIQNQAATGPDAR